MLISQIITKESHTDFSEDELFPIKEIVYTDREKCGSCGPVKVILKNGVERIIDYSEIEGQLQM